MQTEHSPLPKVLPQSLGGLVFRVCYQRDAMKSHNILLPFRKGAGSSGNQFAPPKQPRPANGWTIDAVRCTPHTYSRLRLG